jgi:aldose 1-epimerase
VTQGSVSGRPRSGTQYRLRADGYEAVVASVGASLRELGCSGRDLVVPFEADEVRPAYRGVTLAPWPNRVVDGRYSFDGQEHQLALTEPARGHALHGLLCWHDYAAVDVGPEHVTLTATVEPQTGYPWRVEVETTYSLGPAGLTQSVRGMNRSEQPAPWGTGPHPYLVAGPGPLDRWILELPAAQVLEVTDDLLVPVRLSAVDVDAERFDFRLPRVIGAVEIDHAFTGLGRSDGGRATVRLTDIDGGGVPVAWDTACPWVQVHTADLPSGPGTPGHRRGLAVEPMTCAPDAFNEVRREYDTGLLLLAPGASAEASWVISALGDR